MLEAMVKILQFTLRAVEILSKGVTRCDSSLNKKGGGLLQ